jgi:hypothetical protein
MAGYGHTTNHDSERSDDSEELFARRRRNVLAGAGTALAASISGCLGGDDGTDAGGTELEDPTETDTAENLDEDELAERLAFFAEEMDDEAIGDMAEADNAVVEAVVSYEDEEFPHVVAVEGGEWKLVI